MTFTTQALAFTAAIGLAPAALGGAGNVAVQLKDGAWKITGDSSPNSIVISKGSGGALTVKGTSINGGVTTVNGGSSATIVPNIPVKISMGNGDDRLTLQESSSAALQFLASLEISMGNGKDALSGSHLTVVGKCTVNMGSEPSGSGNESAAFFNVLVGSMKYVSERTAGSSSFKLVGSTVQSTLEIKGPDWTNSVVIASSSIGGSLTASMGDESPSTTMTDHLQIVSCTVAGDILVSMGSGRSVATLDNVKAPSVSITCGSYSHDQFLVYDNIISKAQFDGGSGSQDSISGSKNLFSSSLKLKNIEKNNLKP